MTQNQKPPQPQQKPQSQKPPQQLDAKSKVDEARQKNEFAVTRQKDESKNEFLKRYFSGLAKPIQQALGKWGIDQGYFISQAMSAFRANPKLIDCNPASLVGCILQAAQLRLRLDPVLGQAWLIPFSNQAQFIPGYRGLIVLATRSPNVKLLDCDVVYKNDAFEFARGNKNYLRHSWTLGVSRGDIIGTYAKVTYQDGSIDFEIMDVAQLEKVRAISKNKDGSIWKEHRDEMYRKAPIRRLAKRLTLTSEEDSAALARAVHLEEVAGEKGIPQGIDIEHLDEKGQPEVAFFTGDEQEAKFEDVVKEEDKEKSFKELVGKLEWYNPLVGRLETFPTKEVSLARFREILSEIDKAAASEKITPEQRSILIDKMDQEEKKLEELRKATPKPAANEPSIFNQGAV